jgi:hypothetical protein
LQQAQVRDLISNRFDFVGLVSVATARKPFLLVRSDESSGNPHIRSELVKIALANERILHTSSLATVTENFIVLRRPDLRVETIIGLRRISKIRHIERSRPGFLVIASAAYLLAAAAGCSEQGEHAGFPLACLGTALVVAYFMSRRGAVAFVVDREATETSHGSLTEAAEIVKALVKALPRLLRKPRVRQAQLVNHTDPAGVIRSQVRASSIPDLVGSAGREPSRPRASS